MKKDYLSYTRVLVLILLMIFVVSGCSLLGESNDDQEKSQIQLLWESTPEDVAAILINQPTEEQMKDFPPAERLVLGDSPEKFLLIPSQKIEEIAVWRIEFKGSDFVREREIFNNYDPDDDYVLEIEAIRPEGGPQYQLSFIGDQGETNYYITYDGKDGTPNIEYIFYEK